MDKALYLVDGKPMIERAFSAASAVSSEVIIAVNDWTRASSYSMLQGARFVVDEGFKGPLGGIFSGLKSCSGDIALILPNDMPRVTDRSLSELLGRVDGFDVVTFILPNGALEAVMAIKVDEGRKLIELLKIHGRNKITDIYRGVPRLLLLSAAKLGISGELININTRNDLNLIELRGDFDSDILLKRDFDLNGFNGTDVQKSLWGTISTGDPWSEAIYYAEMGVPPFLMAHTLLDSRNPEVRRVGHAFLRGLAIP